MSVAEIGLAAELLARLKAVPNAETVKLNRYNLS